PVGIVTGHEFVGVVERIGSAVSRVEVGQRVSAEGHITSGTDYNSRTGNAHIAGDMQILGVDRDGCFADYVIVPEENVWQIHDDIPDHYAAVLDPLGNAVHTVMSAGVSTRTVLITGVGMIGLMSVPVARAAGAARIFAVDTNPHHLDLARKLGAEQTFQVGKDNDWVETIRSETRGDGVDVLLEMSGAPPAIDAGFDALRRGGTAAILGIPREPMRFDLTKHLIFKGSTVVGVNGRRMWETWYQMENLLLSGRVKLDDIITHTMPIEEYATAFDLLLQHKALKIVLDVNGPTR
ncbi:MAG: zinc-binding dehydrogenase, partial [Phycisphaerales bacterium]|nr:zinc-binding dehydrogenase [Phycisphaerales bacterium]